MVTLEQIGDLVMLLNILEETLTPLPVNRRLPTLEPCLLSCLTLFGQAYRLESRYRSMLCDRGFLEGGKSLSK